MSIVVQGLLENICLQRLIIYNLIDAKVNSDENMPPGVCELTRIKEKPYQQGCSFRLQSRRANNNNI